MNRRLIAKVIGFILMLEGAFMLLPIIVALICGEDDWRWFIITGVICALAGLILYRIPLKKKSMHALEGYFVVAAAWIVLSAFGAIPFTLSGTIPNYLDALFETVSGFTTTGCTILDDIEVLSHSMLFWRSFTHWIGGMGILVFMLAISPVAGNGNAIYMLRAESPGPVTEKISPKISTTAKYLYLIYFGFTVMEIIALCISGLSLFKSSLLSFGTMATGGFSYLNSSVAELTFAQQNIILVFMLIAGINFSLYFLVLTGKFKSALKNEEFHWYAAIYILVTAIVTLNTFFSGVFDTFAEALHHVAFSAASVITTTGFSTTDMDLFPWFSKNLLLFVMFFGACAGSTAGGIKVSRIAIAFKSIKSGHRSLTHSRSVTIVRFNGKKVDENVTKSIMYYICIFIVLFAASMFIVSLDPRVDFTGAFSAVDTTINNNGIAFGSASGTFSSFKWYSKVVFIIDMLIGRLEIMPMMVFFGRIFSPVSNGAQSIKRKVMLSR